jgi:Protein of unknown function (DUF3341)
MAKTWVLGEFADEPALCRAARRLRALGHASLDAYSPVPMHDVDDALGLRRSPVPLIALLGGLAGATGGYVMQAWMNGVDYAINVANRPPHSPPANIPITFESGVLIAALSIVFGLFALAGFPRTHHPVFEVEGFRTASVDGLWLSAEVGAEAAEAVATELQAQGAVQVSSVPEEAR